jgi:hypothetical protein
LPLAMARTRVFDVGASRGDWRSGAELTDERLALLLAHDAELHLHTLDTREFRDFALDAVDDRLPKRAAADREQRIHADVAAADRDLLHHVELDDAPVELGVHHAPQRVEHLLSCHGKLAGGHACLLGMLPGCGFRLEVLIARRITELGGGPVRVVLSTFKA